MNSFFEKMSPEDAGIPSEAIFKFIRQLEDNNVNIHGFAMLSGDRVIAEGYWKPFHKDFGHRMYSIAKSFTSLAIGLLQEEGKLKINDFICDYFPEKLPTEGVHPFIKAMTIRDMLCMTTAHKMTTFKRYGDGDWVESFFHVEPSHYPGTVFSYDTSSAHVLAALVEKLSGMEMLEYLRYKFLNKIGFSKEAYMIKDPQGVSQGGSGLICTLRDLAKVAYVCTNGGKFEGEQLFPADYLKEATAKQVDTELQPFLDEQQGYGYQIWRSRHDGFCFYGMGGQLAVCFPEHNFVFVTNADTQGYPASLQNIYDAFYQQVFPYVELKSKTIKINTEEQTVLECALKNLNVKPLQGVKEYQEKQSFHISLSDNPMKMSNVSIELKEKEGIFKYDKNSMTHTINFGIGEFQFQKFPGTEYNCMSSGAWGSDNTFHIQVNVIGECFANVKMSICFKEDMVVIFMKRVAEAFLVDYEGVAVGKLK